LLAGVLLPERIPTLERSCCSAKLAACAAPCALPCGIVCFRVREGKAVAASDAPLGLRP
jgi:hypothetical protein